MGARLPLACALLLLSTAVGAQARPAGDSTGARGAGGIVAGVVYDSIAGRALPGATVIVSGVEGAVETNSQGRFVARRVAPGRQSAVAYHPAFDSLGIAALQVVEVTAGDSAEIAIAGPSLATLWKTSCGSDLPGSKGLGLVFGSVRDARSGAPVSGATASLSWIRVDTVSSRLQANTVGLDLVTDRTGGYAACGVDIARDVAISVKLGETTAGENRVTLDDRRVARVNVLVDATAALTAGAGTGPAASGPTSGAANAAAPTARAILVGRARGEAGTPIPGAIARIAGTNREVRADTIGRFVMGDLPPGSRVLEVVALGHRPASRTIDLRPGDTTRVEIDMQMVQTLSKVVVRARRMAQLQAQVEERGKLGFGTILTGEEIRKRPSLRSALQDVPNVRVESLSRMIQSDWGVVASRAGETCVTNVLVDGRLTDWEEARLLPPRLIAAVEIYPHVSTTLIQLPPKATGCGTVAFWTER